MPALVDAHVHMGYGKVLVFSADNYTCENLRDALNRFAYRSRRDLRSAPAAMAALPDARGATADPGIVSGLRRSAADEFFFRSALNQLDTHAARPVHEGDAQVPDRARLDGLQALGLEVADFGVDVGHGPAEVIDRMSLAWCGIVAFFDDQPDLGVRVFHGVQPSLQLGALTSEVI